MLRRQRKSAEVARRHCRGGCWAFAARCLFLRSRPSVLQLSTYAVRFWRSIFMLEAAKTMSTAGVFSGMMLLPATAGSDTPPSLMACSKRIPSSLSTVTTIPTCIAFMHHPTNELLFASKPTTLGHPRAHRACCRILGFVMGAPFAHGNHRFSAN